MIGTPNYVVMQSISANTATSVNSFDDNRLHAQEECPEDTKSKAPASTNISFGDNAGGYVTNADLSQSCILSSPTWLRFSTTVLQTPKLRGVAFGV